MKQSDVLSSEKQCILTGFEFSQRVTLRESIPTLFPRRKLLTPNFHLLPFSDLVAKQRALHTSARGLG